MKVGVVQFSGSIDPEQNLLKIEEFCAKAVKLGVKAIFLPECFYSLGNGKDQTPHLVTFENNHFLAIQSLAKKFSVYLIGGSVAFLDHQKVYNRALNFSPTGELISYYDKQNLFSCRLKNEKGDVRFVDEGTLYASRKNSCVVNVEGFKIGISICFDIRFSDLFDQYRMRQVDAISIASSFTVPTGRAHWHLLNRARAIESQCYVLSSSQWSHQETGHSTYGHSLIVDPWGEILADAGEQETMIVEELSKEKISSVRDAIIMS